MSGGAGGIGIGWVAHGRGTVGAYLARRRVRQQVLDATEAELSARGVPIPAQPQSLANVLWHALISGLALLLVGLVIWKLI